jgi:hypothetical protein
MKRTKHAAEPAQASGLQPFRALVAGPYGTGKTTSLRTLVQAGLKVYDIALDPGSGVLAGSGVKVHYQPYAVPKWATLKKAVELTRGGRVSDDVAMAALARITGEGGEDQFAEFLTLLDTLAQFRDPVTGEELGDVAQFGTDTVLAIDGLTGLSKSARYLVAGAKPSLTWPEFNATQQHVSMFLDICTLQLGCHFVLITHLERRKDDVTGATYQQIAAIGQALGPVIPVNFNDAILAWEDGGKHGWATTAQGLDLKHTYLPSATELEPSFVAIVDEWKRRGGIISPEPWRG